ATPASRGASRCDAAWSVERLDEDERSLLRRACLGEHVDPAEMHKVHRRLLGGDGWHAGTLAWLVGPQRVRRWSWDRKVPEERRTRPPAIDELQRKIDSKLGDLASAPEYRSIRESPAVEALLEAATADEEPEDLPFDSDFLRRLGIADAMIEGNRLLTIRSDGLDSLVVAFGDARSTLVRYFGRDDMVILGKHRFALVAVPEGTPVTLVGSHRGQEVPLLWRSVVGRNQAVWMVPVHQSCVSLNVRMGVDDRLFVDGTEVPALVDARGGRAVDQPMILSRDLPFAVVPDHELAVLTCEGDDACAIRYLSRIPATTDRPEPRHLCEPFRLDLRPRERQQVAIVRTARSESCRASPLWSDDVGDRVRTFFATDPHHRARREVADVYAYAEIAGALASLEREINRGDGKAIGPDRGIDSSEALGTVAKEAWRQGLDILSTLEVQCIPRPNNPEEHTYAISATMIGVDEIFGRGYYGNQGLDLQRFIHTETIAFDEPSLQEASLAALLDRLFQVPSSRFIHDRMATFYRDPLHLRVGSYFGGEDKVPEALPIVYKRFPLRRRRADVGVEGRLAIREERRPPICDQLARSERVDPKTMSAIKETLERLPGRSRTSTLNRSLAGADRSTSPRGAIHRRDIVVTWPGWYLVVREDESGEIADAICVDARYRRSELWGEVMISGGPLFMTYAEELSTLMGRARVGYVRYLFPGLGVGVRGGYGLADHSLSTGVTSWQDLDTLSPAIRWQRHSLMLGPLIEARTRWTAVPFELRARISPFLDLGLISLAQVPSSLKDFRGKAIANNLIIDVDVGVDLDLIFGYSVGRVELQHGLLLGVMAIDDAPYRTAVTASEGFAGVFGFTFGVGAGRSR
ncbi:MAG: hypothetical protein KC420_00380, partial [Myxococcales bacterium]|nr:hypothetical protein [Myxococcales bacterium]